MKKWQDLLDGFLADSLSPSGLEDFLTLSHQHDQELSEAIEGLLVSRSVEGLGTEDQRARLLEKLLANRNKPAKIKWISWQRLAVAASVLLMLGVGSYYLFFNRPAKQPVIVQDNKNTDISAPQVNRATITLANGQRVFLDSAANGQLASQDAVSIVKLADGQIVYNGNDTLTTHRSFPKESFRPLTYNTLTNPRGSKVIDMSLSDGSHIWLNAGSAVTYPVAFTGNERKVSITGEAYFEVAHDASKPFYVTKGDMQVQVLGTHFNVNAYDDEEDIKVTLLEGSVKVKSGTPKLRNSQSNEITLKPGEQAQIRKIRDTIRVIRDIDVIRAISVIRAIDPQQTIAWKNGQFKYNRTDLKVIMREIGRWYDIDVNYEGNIPVQLYNIDLPRTVNVSEVLKGLEYTGAHFTIEGKKIRVRP